MARPWPKRSSWPRVGKRGRRSYVVGFYDHERRERSRTFPSVRHARAWMDDYVTAERRGRESLRRFLLDLDAKEANELEAHTIAEVLELYLAVNAHPRNEGGLAPITYARYESVVGRHMLDKPRARGQGGFAAPTAWAVALASVPAVRFNGPQAPRAWREQMLREGVPKPTRHDAWRVLLAALSWAAASHLVPRSRPTGASSRPNRAAPNAARCALGAPATPRVRAVDRSCPAGRSRHRPSRLSAPRCSTAPRGARRSSRSATQWS